ncbi:MAG: 30S ribosomal protein S1 [Oscillospiraceae bacterium]|nr:30S ribosomal protein S1 [Oscillospiraceae bacterium]
MNDHLPEGMDLRAGGFTMEALRRAKAEDRILQASAVVCTETFDLLVDLGCCMGRIEKDETALGMREGTVRPIAVLSRVGKPVSFKVTEISPGGQVSLSRRSAQEEARSHFLSTRHPGDIIPAVVTSPAAFGAFCDIGCGVAALMGIEAISVSRIEHSRDRFREDQKIFAAIRSIDYDTGRVQLTHRELLGTWEENAALFRAGQTVTGIVRSIKEYGAFIELTPNLSGLAEPNFDLRVGDVVSVYIKSILPERQKIKLVALRKLDPASQPERPLRYFRTSGHLDRWQYGPQGSAKTITVF